MNVNIRREKKDDFNEVFEVNKLAFGNDNEANLVDLLRLGSTFVPELSLIATMNYKIIGHILFTKIQIINDNKSETESLALAPMAVRPEFQRQGVGGQLINYGLDRARTLNFKSVIVLGHKDYYPKFGFEPTKKWNIKSPFKISDNGNFMGIELIKDGLNRVSGLVKYPKEFETL